MCSSRRRRLSAWLVVAASVCVRHTLAAEPPRGVSDRPVGAAESELGASSDEVESLFQHAKALHREKRWAEARAAYDRAWQLQKSFQIAANLALVELRLGRARDAAEHLTFALAHLPSGDPKIAEARRHLEAMLKQATSQIGTLRLDVEHEKAIVYVDDQAVGEAPLEQPLYLEAGSHVVHVEASGAPRITRELVIEPGVVYRLTLPAAKAAAPPRTPDRRARGSGPADRGAARSSGVDLRYVVVGVEAALTATALGFGLGFALQSLAYRDRADEVSDEINSGGDPVRVRSGAMCDPSWSSRPAECKELAFMASRAETFTDRSVGAFVIGGGLAVATVATYLLWPAPRARERSGGSVRVTASFDGRSQAIGVAGAF